MGSHCRIEMAGLSFGKWCVLSPSHQSSSGNWYWNCLCSCGKISRVGGSTLRRGDSTQCKSCSSRENGRRSLYKQSELDPVYFIRCGEYVKIGSSKDIKRRLKDLECSNPYPLELLGVDTNEEFWHILFKHRLHRGEWYLFPQCEVL